MDVRTYLRAIRKSWWALLLAVVLGGGAGYAYSAHATPVYAAHVQFFVGTQSSSPTDAQSTDQFAQSRAISYAKLLSSGVTAQTVVDHDPKIGLTAGPVSGEISGSADINTTLIDATVQDISKPRALRIAKSLAAVFPGVALGVEPPSSGQGTTVRLKVTDQPSVLPTPVSPRTNLNILLGVALGLALGLIIAVLRFLRDTSVRTRDDVESIAGAPLVGDIVFDSTARTAPLVLEAQARSLRGEAFRQLRTNLQFVDAAEALRVIVVTSSTESEGKSTTAANLALTFAETGRSVVLVGADLRRPRISEYLSIEQAVGLTNVLVNQVSLDEALQPWGADGLQVLASGAVPPNPSELLGSPHMVELLDELRARFDLVIIDTPPLLPVTDAAVLAVHADGVVVVCRHGRTRRAQLANAVRSLTSVNARIVGVVLNMRPVRDPDSDSAGSYQYYAEAPRRDGRFWRRAVRAQRRGPVSDPAFNLFPALPTASRPVVPATAEDSAPPATPAPEPTPEPASAPAALSFADRVGPRADADDTLSAAAREAYQRRRNRAGRRSRMRLPGDAGVIAEGSDVVPASAVALLAPPKPEDLVESQEPDFLEQLVSADEVGAPDEVGATDEVEATDEDTDDDDTDDDTKDEDSEPDDAKDEDSEPDDAKDEDSEPDDAKDEDSEPDDTEPPASTGGSLRYNSGRHNRTRRYGSHAAVGR